MQHGNIADRLTEFAPLEPEAKQTPSLFARLFKRGNGSSDASSQVKELKTQKLQDEGRKEQKSSSSAPPSTLSSPAHVKAHSPGANPGRSVQRSNSAVRMPGGGATAARRGAELEEELEEEEQTRTLSGVLNRLGNILERRGQIPQAYKDSDFKQYWMPDSNCKQCYECGDRFTTFRRRHHCRICGQIFCSRCCNQEVPGRIMGYTGYLRVCTYCCKVVLNFAQNINTSGDVPGDLKENLQETRSELETLQGSYGSHDQVWVSPSGRRTKVSRVPSFYREDLKLRVNSEVDITGGRNLFDITPQSEYTNPQTILEERKTLLKDSVQLRELWILIQDPYNGIELQNHRHRLRTYPNCIIGSELVDWLVTNDKANSRTQAIVIGQALVDAQWLECITSQEQIFCDSYSLYKPGETAIQDPDPEVSTPLDSSFLEDESEPQWFREITDGSDEENEVSSDLNKIPSTLSAPISRRKGSAAIEKLLPKSQSVFYIDPKAEGAEPQHWLGGQRPKVRNQSGNTNSSDPGQSVESEGLVHLDPQLGWQNLDNLREENGERLAFQRICKAQWEHLQALTHQLLSKDGLSMKWADVILRITQKISKQVRPNVKLNQDDMDIRQYVQVKKIAGSSRGKTEIVCGVVCTKNIQHRKMRHAIQNPSILLLRAPIEYQRVENKFSSLEPQILQEHDYLKNCVARIAALQPDILLVEKTVSRVAQEFILDTGITLVSNVKPSVMERVSRFTQTDIVTSIDGLVSKTTLGMCSAFHVQNYKLPDGRSKTLMFFDGCDPILGCSVTLRGGPAAELKKVKNILQFITYVTYHLKLELSYLMDSFAMPPPHPDEKSLDLSSSEELSPEREATHSRKPITLSLEADQTMTHSPGTEMKKNGWVFVSEDSIGGNPSSQTKPIETNQSNESKVHQSLERPALNEQNVSSQTDLINKAVISVLLSESKDKLAAESEDRKLETDASNKKQGTIPVPGGTNSSKAELPNVSEPKETKHSGLTEHKTTLIIRQSSVQPASEASVEKNTKGGSQDSLDKGRNKTGSQLNKSGGVKRVESDDSASPLGLPSMSQLDVEQTIMRSRSNSTDARRLADIKRHKRSVSDIALSVTPVTPEVTVPTTGVATRGSKEISDFSDPLQDYQRSKDESIFHKDVDIKLRTENWLAQNFKKALGDVIVCVSPLQRTEIPYLETSQGMDCKLRKYFPPSIYWSEHFETTSSRKSKSRSNQCEKTEDVSSQNRLNVEMTKKHEFLEMKLTVPIQDPSIQVTLADFRARGGRLIPRHLAPYQNSMPRRAEQEKETAAEEQNEESWDNRVDCLDPKNHQRVAVLFSSFSYESNCAPYPCVSPWVVTMDFYGRKDITLGAFLERYCFRENYSCPSESCDTPNIDHIRRFVHESGCLTVSLRKLEQPFPVQNTTLMWGVCKKCRQVTPVVPMSLDSWSMSFAKYLELHFHGNQYVRRGCVEECGHNLHSDHFQCFGFKQTMASFKFSSITLREVALPSIVVEIAPIQLDVKYMHDEAKMLNYKGTSVFNAIIESLLKLQHDSHYVHHIEALEDYEMQLQTEQNNYRHKIEALSTMLTDLSREKSCDVHQSLVFVIKDLVLEIKRQIAKVVIIWNDRFQDLDMLSRKSKNQSSGQLRQSKPSTISLDTSESSPANQTSNGNKATPPATSKGNSSPSLNSGSNTKTATPPQPSPPGDMRSPSSASLAPVNIVVTKEDGVTLDTPTFTLGEEEEDDQVVVTLAPVRDKLGDINPAHFGSPQSCQSIACVNVTETKTSPLEATAAKPGPACPELAVESPEGDKTLLIKSSSETKTKIASNVLFTEGSLDIDKVNKEQPNEKNTSERLREKNGSDLEKVNPEKPRGGMKQIFSSLLYNSGAVQIQMPFTPDEHHLLPPCESIPVIIYDEEPSSIIAYTLSSSEYQYQVDELKDLIAAETSGKTVKSTTAPNSGELSRRGSKGVAFVKRDDNPIETPMKRIVTGSGGITGGGLGGRLDTGVVKYTPRLDGDSLDDLDETDFAVLTQESEKSKSSKQQKEAQISYHIELQFSDACARFYCKVYYADQFRQLRKLIFPEGEERFIRSLSRCFTWLARGGKSGSAFCKTQDDRFILKQMSRYEVLSFVEFAPHYFDYITQAHNEQKPSALAKILGVYRIGFSNSQNNASLRQDVLVMENLFYNRNITQIFDLKGSVRNRLVSTLGKRVEELVLLDENLLKLALDSPLYIRPHSKTVLTLGITNDTQFLSSHLVMDYSLLVGMDENTKELVVGIIDYIRTFTWDKKIEMVVKSTYSHIGGQGKMPTVVSPEVYRSRFLEAMDRYFLHVPDQWTGLGQNVDC